MKTNADLSNVGECCAFVDTDGEMKCKNCEELWNDVGLDVGE